jgi:hypothetical protein
MFRNHLLPTLALVFFTSVVHSQQNLIPTGMQGQLHGNFQMLFQQYNEDSLIGAQVPEQKTAMNAFGNFTYTLGGFSAGVRFESYLNSILGYPGRFKGTGIGYRYAQYKNDLFDITVGNFYEQFGSGMALRTYWEPNLGIDNSLDGMRIIFTPYKGISLKGIYGHQRLDFINKVELTEGIVRGLDGEIFLNDLFTSLAEKKTKVMIGSSFVSKYQSGETIQKDTLVLELPNNVGTSSARFQINRGGLLLSGEYVKKINDPNADNGFIYKDGEAILFNAGYSAKGFGFNLGYKFVDNMAYRSDRDLLLFDVPINFLPAITKQHTYNLAATLYPYATVINGEVGAMAEVFYTFKKESLLGGKYGTNLSVNFAAANSLDSTRFEGREQLIEGYQTNSYGFGDTKFVRDLNIELKKKISKDLTLLYTYYYFEFNAGVTPVTVDYKGIVYADIHVAEVQYKIKPKHSIRVEAQVLFTEQDKKDWATLLAEYTFSPHWTIGVLDQYNYGNDNVDNRVHYLYGTVGYINGSSRISFGYGKRREGIFCIGGVCRAVPASNGIELTISSSF